MCKQTPLCKPAWLKSPPHRQASKHTNVFRAIRQQVEKPTWCISIFTWALAYKSSVIFANISIWHHLHEAWEAGIHKNDSPSAVLFLSWCVFFFFPVPRVSVVCSSLWAPGVPRSWAVPLRSSGGGRLQCGPVHFLRVSPGISAQRAFHSHLRARHHPQLGSPFPSLWRWGMMGISFLFSAVASLTQTKVAGLMTVHYDECN